MVVKELNLEAMREIYNIHMQNDFPQNERKPFSSIERMVTKGEYRGYGLYQGEKLMVYWLIVEMGEVLLLDYLAVVSGKRGRGYGSQALQQIQARMQPGQVMLVEAEDPERCDQKEDSMKRLQRLRFYQGNGAFLTEVRTEVFQAPYVIFTLHAMGDSVDSQPSNEWIREVYRQLYEQVILTPEVFQREERNVKIL